MLILLTFIGISCTEIPNKSVINTESNNIPINGNRQSNLLNFPICAERDSNPLNTSHIIQNSIYWNINYGHD